MKLYNKKTQREKRQARIRAKVSGTPTKPRLSVFRSNRAIYAQLIDDTTSTTLAAADSRNSKDKTLLAQAEEVGSSIAAAAKKIDINQVVFDRGGYKFHGAVKQLADTAREQGLTF